MGPLCYLPHPRALLSPARLWVDRTQELAFVQLLTTVTGGALAGLLKQCVLHFLNLRPSGTCPDGLRELQALTRSKFGSAIRGRS